MKIAKVVCEGEIFPRFYGFAWAQYDSRRFVCYPIPLNWIARWIRDLWHFLMRQRKNYESLAYMRGLERGREVAKEMLDAKYEQGIKEGKRILAKRSEKA